MIIEAINVKNRSSFRNGKKWIVHSEDDKRHHLSLVAHINELNTTWKAVYNRFASRALNHALSSFEKTTLISKFKREYPIADSIEHIKLLKSKKLDLPKQFDARLQWPLCWSVHQVANQGECGSCWALSATSVMSDRLCIATNYSNQKQISAEDLLSCCDECGGCQGTKWALSAFIHWRDHGIVTGGDYGSFEGCKPYTIASDCGNPCAPENYWKKIALVCQRTCQSLYGHSYEEDLIR
ncbi:papain family cysteine protease, partial [Onchocerca flexuosa]